MARKRSSTYILILKSVMANDDKGIPYERLVNIAANDIEYDRAIAYRLARLKRTPSETRAETIWAGQKAIARKYIDAARRYGRIKFIEKPLERLVKLGEPANTGGAYSRPKTWAEEESALSDPE